MENCINSQLLFTGISCFLQQLPCAGFNLYCLWKHISYKNFIALDIRTFWLQPSNKTFIVILSKYCNFYSDHGTKNENRIPWLSYLHKMKIRFSFKISNASAAHVLRIHKQNVFPSIILEISLFMPFFE